MPKIASSAADHDDADAQLELLARALSRAIRPLSAGERRRFLHR